MVFQIEYVICLYFLGLYYVPVEACHSQSCLFLKMFCSELPKSFKELQTEIKIVKIIMEARELRFHSFQYP